MQYHCTTGLYLEGLEMFFIEKYQSFSCVENSSGDLE